MSQPPYQPSYSPQYSPYGAPPPKPRGSGKVIYIVLAVVGVFALCCGGGGIILAVLGVNEAQVAAQRQMSRNNLKMIGLAMHNYHDTYKTFPPAYIPDENGRPRTSWRTMLLPFLEEQPLYQSYNFNVAWDDPANATARSTAVSAYQPGASSGPGATRTSYVVVTSPADGPMRTAFPGEQPQGLAKIYDGSTNTILVLEIRNSDIEWAEPRDVNIDSLNTDPAAPNSIDLQNGVLAVMASGEIRQFAPGMTLDELKVYLTAGGGEPAP